MLVWPGDKASFKAMVSVLNKESELKFTLQIDTNYHRTNFLDIDIEIKDGRMHTKIYRKPTWVPSYIRKDSSYPAMVKKNIIYNEALRARKICSTNKAFELEMCNLTYHLQN
ncbi:hypothetical protein GJ496_008251 [Pomphorhynchus laevis]|nr:hypothetical protein GJ496_008251 [Pomphorhynchus laevis]